MPSVNVTTTAALVVPSGSRRALILQNVSDADITFAFRPGVTATGADAGLVLKPDETFAIGALAGSTFNTAATPVYALHAGSGDKVLRWEALPSA